MKLSTNPGYLSKKRNGETRDILECIKICKNAGFELIDFCVSRFTKEDNWREYITDVSEKIKEMGVTVDQTHAPFIFKNEDPDFYKEWMQRSFEASKILGAKHIVIHADKYIPDENGFDFDKALNEIYDFYAPYVEYSKKAGLGVAVENLFEPNRESDLRSRFTSFVDEQKAIIEKFNDPSVTACWDFGHGRVSYGDDQIEAMKQLGSLITCTHVHDNVYRRDWHQNIFFGQTNWEEVIAYLRESNYAGNFTFEMVYGIFPDALVDKYMKLFYETGEYLLNI